MLRVYRHGGTPATPAGPLRSSVLPGGAGREAHLLRGQLAHDGHGERVLGGAAADGGGEDGHGRSLWLSGAYGSGGATCGRLAISNPSRGLPKPTHAAHQTWS